MRGIVGFSLLAAFVLAAPSAEAAKTLVFCSEASPDVFNPQVGTTGTSFDAGRPIYSRLVAFERGTLNIVPDLAESWTISDDAKTYTFHLRRGVKWQSNAKFKPSRAFNADDVLFTFNREWKADHPFHAVSGGHYNYFDSMGLAKLLESIEAVDEYTVKFVLKQPEAPFLADLAMDFAVIISAEYGDLLLKAGTPDEIDHLPIGTGPFAFVAYEKDATIRYRAFADYWGPKQKLDGLIFSINKDPQVRLAKLQAGECHIMVFPNPADLPAIEADPQLTLAKREGLNVGYLAFNTTKKPFDDKRVRQALAMAINKTAIIDSVYQGRAVTAKNLIPPTIWSYDNDIVDYPYDPDKAKALLNEAGFGNGFESELWYMPVSRPYNPNGRRIGELMQADLAKVGVNVKLTTFDFGEYLKRIFSGDAQMAQLGWTGDNGDPDNFFNVLLSCAAAQPGGSNGAKWCNKDFDDVVNQAKRIPDRDARAKLYRRAQEIMHEEVPLVPFAHSIVYEPMRKEVLNYKMSPLNRRNFDDVDLQE
jgi:dipeptide transport system substrate-binding protein